MLNLHLGFARHHDLGGGVKHTNAFVYYGLSAYIREAVALVVPGVGSSRQHLTAFIGARNALNDFQKNEDPAFFRSSLVAAKALSQAIHEVAEAVFKKSNTPFTMTQASRLGQALLHFETLLQKELADLPLFCVDEKGKGNLSLPKLIKKASDCYSHPALKKLSKKTRNEIDESG